MPPSRPTDKDRGSVGLSRFLPILDWGAAYGTPALASDLVAAMIVTIMLIPQSLAYALLAGMPPQAGLYASIAPLIVYALFGTSRVLAVGPVAVVSLMTASAVGQIVETGTANYAVVAALLAFLSGLMLLVMGAVRLGALATFLSHPVISGFITASGLIIATSQLRHLFGIDAHGETFPQLVASLAEHASAINPATLAIGAVTTGFLLWTRSQLKPVLMRCGWRARPADIVAKIAPVIAVAGTTLAVWAFNLVDLGVRVVGEIPSGMPPFTPPSMDFSLWRELALSAALISVVGFVESVSVAQTLAAKRRQRIVPDQELIGLGASNVAASLSGGFPVTGGFARSVVNFDAGAETPAAGAFTAIGILLAALLLTPLLYYLPKATLGATIIVAVLSLVDFGALKRTFAYSRGDFSAMAATILFTLLLGVEIGILAGVGLSICLHLWRTSRPHCAIVGLVPKTQHFRNVKRHDVLTSPHVVSLRIDESLYFPNARFLEDKVAALVADTPDIRHMILMCTAVNHIDASALESLETINRNLSDAGVTLHLSEVKGPVMDRLAKIGFPEELGGKIFLSQFEALTTLDPDVTVTGTTAGPISAPHRST